MASDRPPRSAARSAVSNDRGSIRRCPAFGSRCQKGPFAKAQSRYTIFSFERTMRRTCSFVSPMRSLNAIYEAPSLRPVMRTRSSYHPASSIPLTFPPEAVERHGPRGRQGRRGRDGHPRRQQRSISDRPCSASWAGAPTQHLDEHPTPDRSHVGPARSKRAVQYSPSDR